MRKNSEYPIKFLKKKNIDGDFDQILLIITAIRLILELYKRIIKIFYNIADRRF
jgi:hypothetical protein